jgi:hypothetical protein
VKDRGPGVAIRFDVDRYVECGEIAQEASRKAGVMRFRRNAAWKPLATSRRQRDGAIAPRSDTSCSRSNEAGVCSSSKYQANVIDASTTTLTSGAAH